jgi:hypothetical protein
MIQNAVTRNAYVQMRAYIHFVNNGGNLFCKMHALWTPLPKIQPAIDQISKTLGAGWKVGERICVDESMMGQFIKHGIKV